MTGELFIKPDDGGEWKDAYVEWGLSMEDGSLSKLMTPAPMKDPVQNKNMAMHGTHIVGGYQNKDVRQVSLTVFFTASDLPEFFERYGRFCTDVLYKGKLSLVTKYQPETEYKFLYNDCQQFTEFSQGLAKFSLTLTEYDPATRPSVNIPALQDTVSAEDIE